MSNSLRPHGLQHATPPCPSPIPEVYPNSCPSNQWCHPTISSSVIPSSSCLQSFPKSGSFLMSQFFSSGSQSIGVSASVSVLPMISFRVDWFDLPVQETLRSLLQHQNWKASIQPLHPFMITWKTIALPGRTFIRKVTFLLFNMLSRSVIAFLLKNLMSLNFMSAVIICNDFGAQKNKVCHYFYCFLICLPWSDEAIFHDLRFLNVEL